MTFHCPPSCAVAAGLRVPVLASDSKALVTVSPWELHPRIRRATSVAYETRMTVSSGKKPVCCGTHSESRLWGPLWTGGPVTVGVTQRKILKRSSGHIR